jgi:hypothetical protein
MRARLAFLAGGLALALAACYPPSPGDVRDSPPDVAVDADGDGHWSTDDCNDADASKWRTRTAYRDADSDSVGAGEPVVVCAGDATLPAGYAVSAGDCDDGRPDRWREVAGYLDADEDGIGVGELATFCRGNDLRGIAGTAGDCAPDDGRAWRELAYAYRDADLDGVSVDETGFVCSGLALPRGYALVDAVTSDCDDADAGVSMALRGWPDGDDDGWGAGEPAGFCAPGLPVHWALLPGDCAEGDASRFRLLAYGYADLDRDGVLAEHTGEVCSGWALPACYSTSAYPLDCDDADRDRWTSWVAYPDADGDTYGAGAARSLCIGATTPAGWSAVSIDCAPDDDQRWRELPYSYRDADGDTRTVAAQGTVCSGTSLPAGYATLASGNDCDDANPDVFASLAGWPDADEDTFGAGAAGTFCTAGALPPGYVANATDCAADDPDRWRMLPYAGVDVDEDTWTTGPAGTLCAGAALPAPYVAKAHGNDCDDAGPLLWRWVVLYEDQDGDGVGVPPRSIPCLGATLPDGWSLLGYDPDDRDPTRLADADIEDLLLNVL